MMCIAISPFTEQKGRAESNNNLLSKIKLKQVKFEGSNNIVQYFNHTKFKLPLPYIKLDHYIWNYT